MLECLSCIVGMSNIYIELIFLQNLQECLGDSFSHFEAQTKPRSSLEVSFGKSIYWPSPD